MSLETQLLTTAATVAATVVVTTLINYFFSIPKKIKQQRAEELEQLSQKIEELEENINYQFKVQIEAQKRSDADIDLLKLGTQAIIKNELKLRYETWLKKGYAPVDAKDDLERMYSTYHRLGANGVLDHMREQFLSLPDERVAKESANKSTKE